VDGDRDVHAVFGVGERAAEEEVGEGVSGEAGVEVRLALLVAVVDLELAVVDDFRAELEGVSAACPGEVVLERIDRIVVVQRVADADARVAARESNAGGAIELVPWKGLGNGESGWFEATCRLVGDFVVGVAEGDQVDFRGTRDGGEFRGPVLAGLAEQVGERRQDARAGLLDVLILIPGVLRVAGGQNPFGIEVVIPPQEFLAIAGEAASVVDVVLRSAAVGQGQEGIDDERGVAVDAV
jgi:hypothetical protein